MAEACSLAAINEIKLIMYKRHAVTVVLKSGDYSIEISMSPLLLIRYASEHFLDNCC